METDVAEHMDIVERYRVVDIHLRVLIPHETEQGHSVSALIHGLQNFVLRSGYRLAGLPRWDWSS